MENFRFDSKVGEISRGRPVIASGYIVAAAAVAAVAIIMKAGVRERASILFGRK